MSANELPTDFVPSSAAEILESVTDGFIALDREWRYTYVNAAAERISQTPRGQLLGKRLWDMFPGAVGTAFEFNYRKALAEQVTVEFEAFFPPQGIWYSVRVFPSRQGLSIYFGDITDHKRNQTALRESEERFRFFAESLTDFVWSARPDGYSDYYNQRFLDYLGRSAEQMGGDRWIELVHPEDIGQAKAAWAAALGSGIGLDIEYRIRRHDGIYRWFWGHAVPMRDAAGRVVRWFGTCTDIEERRRTEKALHEARQKLLDTLEEISDGFIAYDRQWRYTYVNPAATKMLGRRKEELLGRTVAEVFPQAECSQLLRSLETALGENRTVQFESFYPSLDAWYEGRIYPSRDGASLFLTDTTERKRAEAELRQAKDDAEAASRAKDEFLATISHELRTPLGAVLVWAKLLKHDMLNKERQRTAVDTIIHGATDQLRLVDDLLDASRISHRQMRTESHPVHLAAVIRAAVDTIRPSFEAKGVDLKVKLAAPDVVILGDDARLQQVVSNLLCNAVKFTPSGGRVEVRLRRRKAGAEVQVIDTGEGVSAEFVPHLFESFRQADGSITRRHSGLGLGLSIVKSIVELHGGSVSAESNGPGKGATFTVTLPLLTNVGGVQRDRSAGPRAESLPCLRGIRFLVVDDDPRTRASVAVLLETCGATGKTAGSVAEVWAMLTQEKPHVLVSDIAMPGEDGYELIQRLRKMEAAEGGKITTIALTAHAMGDDRSKALESGFDHYFAKPFEPRLLAETIAAVVGQHRKAEQRK